MPSFEQCGCDLCVPIQELLTSNTTVRSRLPMHDGNWTALSTRLATVSACDTTALAMALTRKYMHVPILACLAAGR